MISQGFRTYDLEADDFPITFNASTDASKLPDLPQDVTFLFLDVNTGSRTKKKRSFVKNGAKSATLALDAAPGGPCDILFTLPVRFPAANPLDKPLQLLIVSSDGQKVKDEIRPEDEPIVLAHYVIRFR